MENNFNGIGNDFAEDFDLDLDLDLENREGELDLNKFAAKHTDSRKKIKKASKKNKYGRKKKIAKNALWIFCVLIISVGIAAVVLFCAADYIGIGNASNCEVMIEKGMSTEQIAGELEKAGAIKFPMLYRLYSKFSDNDGKYNYGLYIVDGDKGYESIAETLKGKGTQTDAVQICIKEGMSVDGIAVLMEQNGVCSQDEFKDVAKYNEFEYDFIDKSTAETVYYPVEGYLFPDTYYFYNLGNEEGARLAIEKMLDEFNNRIYKKYKSAADKTGYSFNQIMTMASIVELESGAASDTDKKNVAAVFYNRLSWDEPKFLGSDPTANYGHDDRYNTHKTEGLPPGPLCSPSEQSVIAAINPTEDFTACYFVTDSDFNFYYNDTLAGHNSTIAKLKRQGKWIG